MKTVNTKLLAPLTTTELTNLASDIKETVASEHQQKKYLALQIYGILDVPEELWQTVEVIMVGNNQVLKNTLHLF